ncbi:MAG: putative ABC transport system ATP-binding protein [Pseudohongiellaceae bacterium]|jgi:putative ABC transport system ATP-binding protein
MESRETLVSGAALGTTCGLSWAARRSSPQTVYREHPLGWLAARRLLQRPLFSRPFLVALQGLVVAMSSSPSPSPRPCVEVEQLTKLYHLGGEVVAALDGLDLTIHYGEHVAVVGSSGSGKSTLLQILGCLDSPTSGIYRLDGQAVGQLSESRLAEVRNQRIGFVFQGFHLLPRATARRNVELPLVYGGEPTAVRRERAEYALERVGLAERMNHRPDQLSGGQRQRVAIARALVTEPAILLADEPTGNLDTRTGAEILDLFDELAGPERALIMVTHDGALARRAQRAVVLSDGHLAFDGPPPENLNEVLHS